MVAVSLLIFDMDDVLCRYNFTCFIDGLAIISGVQAKVIMDSIFLSGFDKMGDRGHYTATSYLREFNRRLGANVSPEGWIWARKRAITPNVPMLNLVNSLRAQVPIAMLTNNGPLLCENLSSIFPQVSKLFDESIFFSCKLQSSKEEPDLFFKVMHILGVEANTTFFVDDSAVYVAAACRAGLLTHQFIDIEGLLHELEAFEFL